MSMAVTVLHDLAGFEPFYVTWSLNCSPTFHYPSTQDGGCDSVPAFHSFNFSPRLDPLSYDDVFEEIKAQFDLLDREISPQCQIDYDKFKSHLLNDSLLLAGFDSPGQWARKSKL